MSTQEKVTVVLDIQGEVGNLQSALNKVQSAFNKLNTNNTVGKEFTEDLQDAQKALERLKSVSKKDKITLVDQREVERAFRTFESAYKRLIKTSESKDFLNLDTKRMAGARQGIDSLTQALEQYQKAQKEVKAAAEETNRIEKQQIKSDLDKVKAKEEALYKQITERTKYNANGAKKLAETTDNKEYQKLYEERIKLQQDYNQKKIRLTEEEVAQNDKVIEAFKKVQSAAQEVGKSFPELGEELKNANTPEAIEQVVTKLREIGTTEANRVLNLTTSALGDVRQAAENTSPKIDETRNSLENLGAAEKDIDQLRNRLMYFFGIGNAVQMFKRSIRSAYETLKDLDEVMTETAVVTDFTVGQMWEQLPTYTQRANELGLTIHDVYESMTLFYQQGLNTAEATELSTSALKMARIAGLDAATAVDRVTNALRGFNMELDEASATNIADVYSKLAAITASDVDEISTAMTKVASLASNANMTFENTAAFLAQIIESTRESAETAGTALKTVVARFSEVKKLYNEGDLLGTDEEGNAIDVNKVSTALRTAGINLNEYLTGMKGLDQIFIELAEKWDSLSIVQQRYIATQAAGSRQQSRFIALMSDYQRTLELTAAAQNAEGASQEQYAKTLDSLESKLNQLKNAWDEFTMGILNSDFLKFLIDSARTLLNVLNGITGKLPPLLKSLANLGTIFGGLKLGRNLLFGKNGILGVVGNAIKGKEVEGIGHHLMQGILGGFIKSKSMANTVITTSMEELAKMAKDAHGIEDVLSLTTEAEAYYVDTTAVQTYTAALEKLNITRAQHEVLLSSSLSDEGKELAIRGLKAGVLTEEEIATEGLTDAELKEMLTKKGVNLEEEKSIFLRMREAFLTSAQTGALHKLILATYGEAAAKKLAEKAQQGFNKALAQSMLYIAGYIAIIAGLVIAIAILVKQIQDLDIHKKFEEQSAAVKALNDQLTATKEKIDNIADASNKFNEVQENIEHTVKGTQAWKEALVAANEQVLSLVSQYPELQKFLEIGSQGQLTLQEGAFDTVLQHQLDLANTLTNSYLYESGKLKELRAKVDIVDEKDYGIIQGALAGVYAERSGQYNAGMSPVSSQAEETWMKEFALGNIDLDKIKQDSDYANQLQESLGMTADEFYSLATVTEDYAITFREYGSRLLQAENTSASVISALWGQNEALAKSPLQAAFQEIEGDSGRIAALIEDKIADVTSDDVEKFATKQGYHISGNKVLDKNNQEVEDWSVDRIKQVIAQQKAFSDLEEQSLAWVDQFAGKTQEEQELINRLLSKDGLSLTAQDRLISEEDLKNLIFDEDLRKRASDNINNAGKVMQTYVQGLFDVIGSTMTGRQWTMFMNDFSAESIHQFTDKMSALMKEDPVLAEDIYNTIIDTMSDVAPDKREDFLRAINSITDFKDLTQIENLKTTFEDLGITVNDDFITALINAAHSTTEATKSLEGLSSVLDKIAEGDNKFSEEERDKLVGLGVNQDDFIKDLEDNYIYIGENLAEVLARSTAEEYERQMISYRNAMANGNYAVAKQNMKNMQDLANQQIISGDAAQVRQGLNSNQFDDRTLIAAASAYDDLTDKVDAYQKAIQENNRSEMDRLRTLLKLEVESKAYQKQLNNLSSVINDNADALNAGTEAGEVYDDALNTVYKAAKQVFGEDITKDFIEKNLENFIALANGSEEALKQIRLNLIESRIQSYDAESDVKKGLTEVLTMIATLDGSNFNIDGTFNNQAILDSINAVISSLSLTTEQYQFLQKQLAEFGYSVVWIPDYETIDIPEWDYTVMPGEKRPTVKNSFKRVQMPTGRIKAIKDTGRSEIDTNRFNGGSGGSGGGGGGSEKNDIWENPYDELYNLTEKVNEALRDREKIERDYDRILKNRKSTSQDIINNSLAEIANLRHEIDLQKQLLAGRRRQLRNVGSELHADSEGNRMTFAQWGVTRYASYDESTGLVKIDWDGINAIEDTELGEAVEAYVSRLEELAEQIEDTHDTIEDMSDQIDEIRERSKDDYLELEQRIYDAIVAREQAVIDEYKAISDSIAQSNQNIIDSMQESIDLERQIRDNTKKEEEISDMQTRLAYLQRDTSGANQTEILKLQQQIEDSQQQYQDSLVDQELQRLSDENQKAQEQRERQIEIMQAQLDWNAEQGAFWKEVDTLLSTAFTKDGHLNNNSALVKLLQESDAFKGMSKFGKQDWINDMVQAWLTAQEGLYNWQNPSSGPEYNKNEKAITTNQAKSGTGSGGGGSKNNSGTEAGKGGSGKIGSLDATLSTAAEVKKLQEGLLELKSKGIIDFGGLYADGDYGWYTEQAVKALQRKLNELTGAGLTVDGLWGKLTRAAFQKSSLKKYKTGGLANFTGPAWLDGSLTNPELVLNATDTRNFMNLVDVLRNMYSSGQTFNSSLMGDQIFNIAVDARIDNDYDVERLVQQVKSDIVKESQYRNFNSMSRMR